MIARISKKSLLCEKGISESPCGKCESCIGIDNNNNLDLIEIDAASEQKLKTQEFLWKTYNTHHHHRDLKYILSMKCICYLQKF